MVAIRGDNLYHHHRKGPRVPGGAEIQLLCYSSLLCLWEKCFRIPALMLDVTSIQFQISVGVL